MGKRERALKKPGFGLSLGLCIAAVLLMCALSISLGAVSVDMGGIWQAILGRGAQKDVLILLHVRLPRMLGALLAGAALSVGGLIIQTVLDNPLAGPNIIGVNAGAGFFVVLCAAVFPGAYLLIPAVAFAGALFAILFSYLVAYKVGASRMTLVLSGVAVSSFLTAGINALVTIFPDVLTGTATFRIGGLAGVSLGRLLPPGALIVLCTIAAFLMAYEMDVLNLGEDTAKSLGLSVGRYRFALLSLAAALVGGAVSFAGLIGFVGLIIPHAARFLVGQESRKRLPITALLGAAFTTLCDVLSRVLFAPYEVPLGIVLSFIGAPLFIVMLFRMRGGRG